jgi:DNA-directed RNA polymerase subunit RPC12/RpoP
MVDFFPIFIFLFFVAFFVILATVLKVMLPAFKEVWFPAKKDKSELPADDLTSLNKDYECDHCGAKLDKNADVSPSGDVKCTYCNKWFNIHRND